MTVSGSFQVDFKLLQASIALPLPAVASPFYKEATFGDAKSYQYSQTWQPGWGPCLDSEPV